MIAVQAVEACRIARQAEPAMNIEFAVSGAGVLGIGSESSVFDLSGAGHPV